MRAENHTYTVSAYRHPHTGEWWGQINGKNVTAPCRRRELALLFAAQELEGRLSEQWAQALAGHWEEFPKDKREALLAHAHRP